MVKMVNEGGDDDITTKEKEMLMVMMIDDQTSEIKSTPNLKRKASEEVSAAADAEEEAEEDDDEEAEEGQGQAEEEMHFNSFADLYRPGDTIEIMNLLFPPSTGRDFLVRGPQLIQDVKLDDLRGKTIVLLVVPLQQNYLYSQVNFNVIDAYHEVSHKPDIMFVFVAVRIVYPAEYYSQYGKKPPEPIPEEQEKAYFELLLDTIPFPTIPFDDESARQGVFEAFYLHMNPDREYELMPYWCIVDSDSQVLATRNLSGHLFRIYGGAELYPFTEESISKLPYLDCYPRLLLEKLTRLLESPPSHDFLLKGNDKVPASSLTNKVIGLFFWVNTPSPTFKKLLKDVYRAAKAKNKDFEIVQSRFLFYPTSMTRERPDDRLEQGSYDDDVEWFRVPFKDPRHRKLLRILHQAYHPTDRYEHIPEFLVIVDKQTEGRLRYEISGAHILKQYGVEGYPFTRQALAGLELDNQKKSVTFRSLFHGNLGIPAGRQVLVLFASHRDCNRPSPTRTVDKLVDKLAVKYKKQDPDAKTFEVVYVSTDGAEDSFEECTKDMPWRVLPFSEELALDLSRKLFKVTVCARIAAFDGEGRLMTKGCGWNLYAEGKEFDDLEFPFISSEDTEELICAELERKCFFDSYFNQRREAQSLGYSGY